MFGSTDKGRKWRTFSDGLTDAQLASLATDLRGRVVRAVTVESGVFDYRYGT
jgi:hypothetical protein